MSPDWVVVRPEVILIQVPRLAEDNSVVGLLREAFRSWSATLRLALLLVILVAGAAALGFVAPLLLAAVGCTIRHRRRRS
jgi:hypothetical protein